MADLRIGSTLAGYRIEALIDRGGMGVVYRATQIALDRPVALKVIAGHLAGDPDFRRRFLSESRLAAKLDHPAVVPVYDAREAGDELLVAMRLVEGGDLKRRLVADGPLPPSQAIELLGQVAEALDAAHAAGIVHRDVKPHNILLEGERAYLTDFGLAKALGESGALSEASVVGTAEYMSPEQWRGELVGPAADVYSLGCVLYEALTGVVPYARRGGAAEPTMPAGLDAVIERAVAPDPAARYASAGELIEAARERQGASPAPTRVLSQRPEAPTRPLGDGAWSPAARPTSRLRPPGGWPVALAGGVLAAALAALAAVLLLGGGGVSVSGPIPVGRGPIRLAAGSRSVWATSALDGTLTRIDAASGSAEAPLHLSKGISGVAVGARSVWVSSPREGAVLRIDGDTGRVRARIAVGGRPGAIVWGGERIWVADDGGGGIAAIDPRGDRVFRRGIPPHAAPLRLAAGAGAVWASSATTGTVRRIDQRTARAGAPIRVGRGPAGITVGGGLVWVANARSGTVSRVDPAVRGLAGAPIAVGGRPGGIDAGTDVVWVANGSADTLQRLDIASGEPAGDPVAVGRSPGAVAVGGQAVWVADNGEGAVTRVEP